MSVMTVDSIVELVRSDLYGLLGRADLVRHEGGDVVELCSIVSAKSGGCGEDCAFCAQSSFWRTGCPLYEVSCEEAVEAAKRCTDSGIQRISLVTSGGALSDAEVDRLCRIYERMSRVGIKLCASHGLLDERQLSRLLSSGVSRYHCNLETGPDFFPKICTTHTFEQKVETLKAAARCGMELCSGGLLGLGESDHDRSAMVLALADLGVRSVPLNCLIPIKGTPMEDRPPLDPEVLLRWGAVMQIVIPGATVRYAGGRSVLGDFVSRGLRGGVGGMLTGYYLTTSGSSVAEDLRLIRSLGFEPGHRRINDNI